MTAPASRILGVIPARLASTRLPHKVLRELHGQPLLAWVVEAALRCPQLNEVLVACDSDQVAQLCTSRGWPYLMTSPDLPSGSDRLFAVARQVPADIYVNIQADEPLLEPAHIEALLAPLTQPDPLPTTNASSLAREPWTQDPGPWTLAPQVTTLKVPCPPASIHDPNVVKVVTAADGRALYFSRAPIPFTRDLHPEAEDGHPVHWKHLGLYAYRKHALARFAALSPSPLEQTERLEQLRLLENNIPIHVALSPSDTIGVDTEEDLRHVESILAQSSRLAARN